MSRPVFTVAGRACRNELESLSSLGPDDFGVGRRLTQAEGGVRAAYTSLPSCRFAEAAATTRTSRIRPSPLAPAPRAALAPRPALAPRASPAPRPNSNLLALASQGDRYSSRYHEAALPKNHHLQFLCSPPPRRGSRPGHPRCAGGARLRQRSRFSQFLAPRAGPLSIAGTTGHAGPASRSRYRCARPGQAWPSADFYTPPRAAAGVVRC